jgi:hypothetical protein
MDVYGLVVEIETDRLKVRVRLALPACLHFVKQRGYVDRNARMFPSDGCHCLARSQHRGRVKGINVGRGQDVGGVFGLIASQCAEPEAWEPSIEDIIGIVDIGMSDDIDDSVQIGLLFSLSDEMVVGHS